MGGAGFSDRCDGRPPWVCCACLRSARTGPAKRHRSLRADRQKHPLRASVCVEYKPARGTAQHSWLPAFSGWRLLLPWQYTRRRGPRSVVVVRRIGRGFVLGLTRFGGSRPGSFCGNDARSGSTHNTLVLDDIDRNAICGLSGNRGRAARAMVDNHKVVGAGPFGLVPRDGLPR